MQNRRTDEQWEDIVGWSIITTIIVTFLITGVWAASTNHSADLGNAICKENGYSKFSYYNANTKIIKCINEPDKKMIKYDGLYIEE